MAVPRWEHHVQYLDTSTGVDAIRTELDSLGNQGWELVSITPHVSDISESALLAVFKRQRHSELGEPMVAFA